MLNARAGYSVFTFTKVLELPLVVSNVLAWLVAVVGVFWDEHQLSTFRAEVGPRPEGRGISCAASLSGVLGSGRDCHHAGGAVALSAKLTSHPRALGSISPCRTSLSFGPARTVGRKTGVAASIQRRHRPKPGKQLN